MGNISMVKRKMVIVGGGSAGWMAAAYLQAALAKNPRGDVEITLIESPDIPRISVGEATVPNIHHILTTIGIQLLDFMKATDATFKQSIKYVDWVQNDGSFYHHPFSRYKSQPLDTAGLDWLNSNGAVPFMETVSAQPQICDMGLAPLMLTKWDFGPPLTYAFHMNAQKFADLLTKIATERGATHLRDNVVDMEMKEDGNIAAVLTETGQRIEADLFVDCTGFRAALIEKKLDVGWDDCSQWLLCDRASVMHIPYDHYYPGSVRPYTTATALSNGWVWDIPLQNARSIGYVHSSGYISEEDAEKELRKYGGPHSEELSSRQIKFKVGRREKAWVKNCISIGLSGGFIEPLESTGLYLSDLASVMLAEHFPFRDEDNEAMAFRVNRVMTNRFYEILDFINMHYCLTKRTDTEFWREVQKPERINDRLKAKFDYWKIKPPSASDFEDQMLPNQSGAPMAKNSFPGDHRAPIDGAGLWDFHSYECIMYGMDYLVDEYRGKNGKPLGLPPMPRDILSRIQAAPQKLPPHEIWLQRVLGMKEFPGVRDPRWCSHAKA